MNFRRSSIVRDMPCLSILRVAVSKMSPTSYTSLQKMTPTSLFLNFKLEIVTENKTFEYKLKRIILTNILQKYVLLKKNHLLLSVF